MFRDATLKEIDNVMQAAWKAFKSYQEKSITERALLMRTVADHLDEHADALLASASIETHLGLPRLRSELGRTIFQWKSYADACEKANWMDISIDTADPHRNPPKPDIRKMMIGLGPVVVFGASNFPFAYSTTGGDTASALAAGCSVVVKAHPAHPATSEKVANIILSAVKQCNMPEAVFSHVHGASFEVGKALVMHEHTKSVGFTGSYAGGKQLFDWANQRATPIPVFAEMGSVNPVFLLPGKLSAAAKEMAAMYAASITLSVGQFCTNPGIIIGIKSDELNVFMNELSALINEIAPARMLHDGIAKAYDEKKIKVLTQDGVSIMAESSVKNGIEEGKPLVATISGENFLKNKSVQHEVFGPFSLIVQCKDANEILAITQQMQGQLTATLMATEKDIAQHKELLSTIKNICGRLILNGVPTGVEVCRSMHHGGPFPATTDSRFTAVGADAIKRFARPICFQNWPNDLLPDELKNENPLGLWRMLNNEFTDRPV
jgi:NADP-dependent aldehyde dehydrogenase